MREPTIRKVEKSDIQALAEKANEIWHEYFIPIIGLEQVEYMIDKYQSVKGLTQQINEGYSYYFVLTDHDIVGYFGVQPQCGRLFLSKLYLEKQSRGKGYSKEMLKYIINIAVEQKKSSIYLTVNKYNKNTIDIYKHFGFKIVDEQKAYIGSGFYMDDYIMEYVI